MASFMSLPFTFGKEPLVPIEYEKVGPQNLCECFREEGNLLPFAGIESDSSGSVLQPIAWLPHGPSYPGFVCYGWMT